MPEWVHITEVGPRDGLQNEPGVVPTADKVRLIELCMVSGVDEVEVTSFVSPKWVPQLADAVEVMEMLHRSPRPMRRPQALLSALIPNLRGLETALESGCGLLDKISLFAAASETFSQKNTNASVAETMERFKPVVNRAQNVFLVRAYISCSIACPFEGPIAPSKVAQVARQLADLGVGEIALADTIGSGTPETVRALIDAVRGELGDSWWIIPDRIALHLHDTHGLASDCVRAALDLGIRCFDSSVAGLGGCPYASTPNKRAPGNISTETLVRTVLEAGFATGVNLEYLREAAAFATKIVTAARSSGGGNQTMISITTHESRGLTIRRITFDRPDKKNALTPDMLTRLRAAAEELAQPNPSPVGALLLDGNGAAFCSGFDLSLCKENSDALRTLLTDLSHTIRALRRVPVPVVIAAHGAAFAGGCALLGGADFVVSHAEAKIGYPVVRLGISPAVSAPFLAQSIGPGRARERLLDSSIISGWDAFRAGLVHECLEDAGKVRPRALALAEHLASKPAPAMRATKAWLNDLDGSLDAARADAALETSLSLVGSPEERDRLTQLWKS